MGSAVKRRIKEDWKDVSTGVACVRKLGDGRRTPFCRPSKRVSSKSPKASGDMSSSEKSKKLR